MGGPKRRVDLIDQFTELVVGADDPHRLAERTLEVIMSLSNGRSAALFRIEGDRIALFASRAIDQSVLDLAGEAWSEQRERLHQGEIHYVPEREARGPGRSGPVSFAIVPVRDDQHLRALLYVDSLEPHFCTPHDLERLAKFSRIVSKAVSDATEVGGSPSRSVGWEAYLERTPVEDMEREKLLLLLNRNEWNIARVARLMGVTRRTIYLRLQRYNIPRERVPKSRPRNRQ
jgi:hypothetical protein